MDCSRVSLDYITTLSILSLPITRPDGLYNNNGFIVDLEWCFRLETKTEVIGQERERAGECVCETNQGERLASLS